MSSADIKAVVKEKYGQAALRVKTGGSSCCGTAPSGIVRCDPITSNLYDLSQTGDLPEEAVLASLGCGNPTALAELRPGENVLDLGSGGGIDVFVAAFMPHAEELQGDMKHYTDIAPQIQFNEIRIEKAFR
jgi:arsenite methyltransferase